MCRSLTCNTRLKKLRPLEISVFKIKQQNPSFLQTSFISNIILLCLYLFSNRIPKATAKKILTGYGVQSDKCNYVNNSYPQILKIITG